MPTRGADFERSRSRDDSKSHAGRGGARLQTAQYVRTHRRRTSWQACQDAQTTRDTFHDARSQPHAGDDGGSTRPRPVKTSVEDKLFKERVRKQPQGELHRAQARGLLLTIQTEEVPAARGASASCRTTQNTTHELPQGMGLSTRSTWSERRSSEGRTQPQGKKGTLLAR